jgi:4-hydroxy-tetrahydrodipicolinate reductase
MSTPAITVDLAKIEHNAKTVAELCARHGIEVTGVTKVTCGTARVAQAMLRGGVSGIGESRLHNIARLRAKGVHAPTMLLRIPPLSRVDEVVALANISLNSELTVIKALSRAAAERSRVHEIIIMVDLGDLREGIWPEDLMPLVECTLGLPGVRIVGLGTNLTCYGGVIPTPENMGALVEHARTLERVFGLKLRYISGGNSSALPLLASGGMPPEVNHLRIGETILLGRDTVDGTPWPGTFQDAFLLRAEVIELKQKPSVPVGEIGQDAFGAKPVFANHGTRLRAILNAGREDVDVAGLTPIAPGMKVLGASSDHLLVDVSDAECPVGLGNELSFQLNYAALLVAMSSEYVEKDFMTAGVATRDGVQARSIDEPGDPSAIQDMKMGNIRVGIWGFGAMGSGMAAMLLGKTGVEVVAVCDRDDARVGRDMHRLLEVDNGTKPEVIITDDPDKAFPPASADALLLATDSFIESTLPKLKLCLERGINVITTAEELAYPRAQRPELAAEIDAMAKANGVSVLGTGINPGFVLDYLILALTGACERVDTIKGVRSNDLSPFGPAVMGEQGVGTTVEAFEQGVIDKSITGHVGFPESIRMITDGLGWKLEKVSEIRTPIVSMVHRASRYAEVKPGHVAGCKQCGYGYVDGALKVELEHPQQIAPELEEVETGDFIWIRGTPDIALRITPEIPGGIGTIALCVNMIPQVINAAPGLRTMLDLPVPRAIMGDFRDQINVALTRDSER